jgi:hypothetical protein
MNMMKIKKKITALNHIAPILAITFFSVLPALADNPVDTADYLRRFHENPKATMNDRLQKLDESDKSVIDAPRISFEGRVLSRSTLMGSASSAHSVHMRSEIPDNEQLGDLLSGIRIERRLNELERRGLISSTLRYSPWSGSYWPTRMGGLGWRFADAEFPGADFKSNYAYFSSHPSESVDLALLSPSEKYDLLLGDQTFALTKANWQKGLDIVASKPDVPSWYGICHGWSPAAYLENQPKHPVQVTLADGRPETFYPSDIKALASALWAETNPDIVFLGKKCAKEHPDEDDMGRIVDPACFNTNPGTWHMALVNRIGIGHESFVIDATYDAEVWNQPVASYKYSYFNPQTFATSTGLFGSIIPIEKFTLDKFKKYRSPNTKYIVGIALDLTYVEENNPNLNTGPDRVARRTVRYIYDLELDQGHQIIGGEWYSNKHPDFLWAPLSGFRPVSSGESELGVHTAWSGQGAVPDDLRRASEISSKRAEPLSGVVNTLIQLSQ